MKIGRYHVITRLGAGGMGDVFLARSSAMHGFEKFVAIKRISGVRARNEEFVRMFLEEAKLAATLNHPNIAQVYDVGREGDQYFFAMEYLHGQDLTHLLRALARNGTWLPLQHILTLVINTAAGLHHAHTQSGRDGRLLNIVHRDVSPSNVFVTYDGAVKLLDFGIAKATTAKSVTHSGALKGKIPYMSPEQVRGEKLDQRSDIFSLGILLWELLARRRMFPRSSSDLMIMNMLAYEDLPDPSTARPDVDPDLDRIVRRALKRDRNQRFPTAQQLQMGLEEYARRKKIAVSTAELGRFMIKTFPQEHQQSRVAMLLRSSESGEEQPLQTSSGVEPTKAPVLSNQAQLRLILLSAAAGSLATALLGVAAYLLLAR